METNNFERPPEVEAAEPLVDKHECLPLEIRIARHRPFSMGARIAIFAAGWVLILVGVAGLVLPGLQGIITILAGAALLSLDNELVYRGLRRLLGRWPHLWHRVEHFRDRAHDRIHGWFHRK